MPAPNDCQCMSNRLWNLFFGPSPRRSSSSSQAKSPHSGVTRASQAGNPHKSDSGSSILRLKGKSSSSLSTIPAVRPKVTNHQCGNVADAMASQKGPIPQYKSPTAPKYRPVVTPHHCPLGEEEEKGPSSGDESKSSPWTYFLLALLLLGVAGAGATFVLGSNDLSDYITAFGRKKRRRCE